MSLNLQSTGNTETDIGNIIDALNSLDSSDSISNVLNISALGQCTFNFPGTEGVSSEGTILHNLGYPPIFMVNNLAEDGGFIVTPFTPTEGTYFYNGGPQGEGVYPYAKISARVDSTNLYIIVANLDNPGGFTLPAGDYTFSYYLFSRPITS